MGGTGDTLLNALGVVPASVRDLVRKTGLSGDSVEAGLRRLWRSGEILRSESPFLTRRGLFRGRAGKTRNLRRHYLYLPGSLALTVDGVKYVSYEERLEDSRGRQGRESKIQLIRQFLEDRCEKAWYSVEVREALSERGVKPADVMASVRLLERKGLVYVRGYQSGGRQTPFTRGYLLTWIDGGKPREDALREAVDRTTQALEGSPATHPIIHRVHLFRDKILAASHLKELVDHEQLAGSLGCTESEAETAVRRALQLYPDLREIKIFNMYRHYYHTSLQEEDFRATLEMQQNYIRKTRGRCNRIGHNWEACVEWFIDTFTRGAEFRTQEHRERKMDPRRITLHLLKSVGDRRRNAEVDRVWTITPGLFAQPITYVLECKWGLVSKRDLDDFLEVLRWSTEFGADTESGRIVRNGVIGVFAGSAFNPKTTVHLGSDEISLPTYANRLNLQLIHTADLNRQLHEKVGDTDTTVQKICRYAKDEAEVRKTLTEIWETPRSAKKLVGQLTERNSALYELEDSMEEPSEKEDSARTDSARLDRASLIAISTLTSEGKRAY